MHAIRERAVSVRLPDGRVLVAGGGTPQPWPAPPIALSSSEIFDPVTKTWSVGPSLAEPHLGAPSVAASDGRVLVVGGHQSQTVEALHPGLRLVFLGERAHGLSRPRHRGSIERPHVEDVPRAARGEHAVARRDLVGVALPAAGDEGPDHGPAAHPS